MIAALGAWAFMGLSTTGVCQIDAQQGPVEKTVELEFSSPWLAKLGPVTLTQEEMDASLTDIPAENRGTFLVDRGRVAQRLDQLLLNRLLVHDAQESGLLNLGNPTVAARLYHTLVEVRVGMVRERLRAQAIAGVDFEALARERHLANPDAAREPPTVDFTHLLILQRDRSPAEAARAILAVDDQLRAGDDFDALVAEFSEDAGQPAEGYRDVPVADLDEAFAAHIERMEPGDRVVGPFQSQYGWHLLRLNDRNPGRALEWDEAREQLVRQVRQEHVERALQRHQRNLLDGLEAEVPEEALDALFRRYGLAEHYGIAED
jgi:parvulin-like peptidyl-prolyl isomerase